MSIIQIIGNKDKISTAIQEADLRPKNTDGVRRVEFFDNGVWIYADNITEDFRAKVQRTFKGFDVSYSTTREYKDASPAPIVDNRVGYASNGEFSSQGSSYIFTGNRNVTDA